MITGVFTDDCEAWISLTVWDGNPRIVEIEAAETDPLIGMGLIYGSDLRIQAIEGGTVTIETLRIM